MAARRWWFPTVLLTLAIFLNLRGQSVAAGLLIGTSYLLWCGWLAGGWLMPEERRRWQVLVGLSAHVALVGISGAAIYWLYRLDPLASVLVLAGTPWLWIWLRRPSRPQPMPTAISRDLLRGLPRTIGVNILLVLAFATFAFLHVRWLLGATTTNAIRTPWQVVPKEFFLNYFLLVVTGLALTMRTDRAGRRLPAAVVIVALSVAVPLLVYPLGFGFDAIIHQATERTIVAAGEITPKPLYYVGQYALVATFARLLAVPVEIIDRLAAPLGLLLAALLLYRPWRTNTFAAALPLLLLLLPYGALAATTPQALGNLWLLLTATTVATARLEETPGRWRVLAALTAAAAAVTHPIAGVPALALVASAVLVPSATVRRRQGSRRAALIAISVLAAAALPLLFSLNALANGFTLAEVWRLRDLPQRFSELLATLLPWPPASALPLLDFTYAVDRYRPWLIAAVAAVGVIALPYQLRWSAAGPLLASGAAMLASFVVLSLGVTFPQLVGSEQLIFPRRAFELAQLLVLPLAVVGGAAIFDRCRNQPVLRATLLTLLPAVLTAQLYLAYPRADRYHFDHGFNLTAADLDAVRHVAADATGDYLALANQMTSVAAVKAFGFFRSYPAADGSGRRYFPYPIPTGEPLYQRYLEMVERRPSRRVTEDAAALVGADIKTVYFILPRYWDRAAAIAEEAKREADRWWELGDGNILVFRYDLQTQKGLR